MKFHYVYQIENLVNGMLYIGKHSTKNIDDGYMGSGTYLKNAILKYGIENFKKSILLVFETEEQALEYEKLLVTEEFVNSNGTYNLTCGGKGSWFSVNKDEDLRKAKNKKAATTMNLILWKDPEFKKRVTERASKTMKKLMLEGKIKRCDWTGKKHKEESKRKIGEANAISQKGSRNSNFGNVWIHNLDLKISKCVPKEKLESFLDTGWIKGRKMFNNAGLV